MRISSWLATIALLATTGLALEVYPFVADEDIAEDAVVDGQGTLEVAASFPENNPFGHVVNGERNQLFLDFVNKSPKNVTLLTVAGAFHNPRDDKLIKATNNVTYGIYLVEGAKIRLPYTFHSEYKTGDIKLNLFLERLTDGEKQRVPIFESIVTVVEPESSIFDFKLITTYAVVVGLLGSLGYIAYLSFAPAAVKKPRAKAPVSAPVDNVSATGAGGYQEEWIPEHHLRKSKRGKGADSGAETSGAETSGMERRRKGRK